jgi:hypothetical protein
MCPQSLSLRVTGPALNGTGETGKSSKAYA